MKKYSSACTLDCFDCCKFNVYKNEDGEIKIEGDKNHPFTKGMICKKGLYHKTFLNHTKRIKKPMLKKNGEWTEISFEECIDIFVSKLKEYKEENILYYEQYGNGGVLKSIGDIFFNFCGGALKQKGGPCWSAGIKAQKFDYGIALSHSLSDMKNSKNIFVWGKNPANTTIHTLKEIIEAKKSGSKIIVIDPIKNETSKFADIYIRVKPGGDYYLALAMGKIILEKNLEDKEFIKNNTKYFEGYKKLLEKTSIEELSKRSGVSIENINLLVNLYVEKYSSILLGYGIQKYKVGGKAVRAIDALCAITGQIGKSGGGVSYANKLYSGILNTDPYSSEKFAKNEEFFVSDLEDIIEEKNVKMAVITKSNLLNQLPNLNKLTNSFKKINFKVCFDIFMTDTAKHCDLFIPSTTTLESEDIIFSSMTNPYITYIEKVVEPDNKFMDEYYFFQEVAKRLDIKEYPFVSKREYIEKIIENLDESIEDIKNGYITKEIKVPWSSLDFKTPSGKFEFGEFFISEEKEEEKGFHLLTTHTKDSLFSQHFIDVDEISICYINSFEMKKLDLKDKDIVNLKSKNGEIKVKIQKDDKVSNNTVMMHIGWWERSGNPNFLTNSDISDIGGQIAYNETKVFIKK